MRRRDFITLLGGAAAAWPAAARGQQADRMRHVAVMLGLAKSDPEGQARVAAFREELQKLGWREGHNVQFEYRWAADDVQKIAAYASELVGLSPDIIFINSQPVFDAMRQASHDIPIVFVQVTDPVGSGSIASLARPGGNITGFANYESMGGKWLELLKEIAPGVSEAAIILNPDNASNVANLKAIEIASASLDIRLFQIAIRGTADIEPGMEAFARKSNGGVVVLASPTTNANRTFIIGLATRYRLPAIYPYSYFVASGGLISYGVDNKELYRQAASYFDRILRGEKPGDLPVQQPTKFELVVNQNAAKLIGLTIPEQFLLRADDVIE